MSVATKTKPVPRACNPVPFEYRPHDPMPIEAEAEAVAILAKARGAASEQELCGALLILDAELLSCRGRMTDAPSIRREMPRVKDILTRRAVYVSRIGQIRRALKIDAAPPVDAPEFGAFVNVLAGTIDGHDLGEQLATTRARIRAELDQADAAVSELTDIVGDDGRYEAKGLNPGSAQHAAREAVNELGRRNREVLLSLNGTPMSPGATPQPHEYPNEATAVVTLAGRVMTSATLPSRWPQDLLIERLNARIRERKALAARLAAIEDDSAQMSAVVAEHAGGAVEGAGGTARLQVDVVAAWALSGSMPASLVGIKARLDAATKNLRRLRFDLESLESITGPLSSASGAMKLDIERAEAEYGAAHDDWMHSSRAEAVALIEGALRGDESSRSALESLASSRPEAFPPGFHAAIAGARFDRAVASELDGVISTLAA